MAADGPGALTALHETAAALVTARVPGWRETWARNVRAAVDATDQALGDLADGRAPHLSGASVHLGARREETYRYGMCGRLRTWDVAAS